MSIESLQEIEEGRRLRSEGKLGNGNHDTAAILCESTTAPPPQRRSKDKQSPGHISSLPSSLAPHFDSLAKGLVNLSKTPTLVIGVQSDALFPFVQQRELAEALRLNGNKEVVYYELDSPMGHDSFLLDVPNVTSALKGFL